MSEEAFLDYSVSEAMSRQTIVEAVLEERNYDGLLVSLFRGTQLEFGESIARDLFYCAVQVYEAQHEAALLGSHEGYAKNREALAWSEHAQAMILTEQHVHRASLRTRFSLFVWLLFSPPSAAMADTRKL